MRETDISKFSKRHSEPARGGSGAGRILRAIGRALFTIAMIFIIAGVIVGASLGVYVLQLANEDIGINLKARSMNQTSFIYVKNDKGDFKKYQSLYSTENRVWVDFNDIPDNMKEAQIAIEDKRFLNHHGVDWQRTFGAILNLGSGKSSYGGSTLTQQLIKNISDDNEVSLNRKIREIVKALKLEQMYTKDEILEAYLNVVNYGSNCQGVQAAANLYFGKTIDKCSLAECAAIAGITQNPSKYNPLFHPKNNEKRRKLVLSEMLDQEKITEAEYKAALKESKNMTFVGFKKSNKANMSTKIQNWYMDELQRDLRADLAVYYNINETAAEQKLFTEGYKIYCAMDRKAQASLQKAALNMNTAYDYGLQCAATMVDMKGAILASVGSSQQKSGNLILDRATGSSLQPGSTIKPVVAYPYAIEHGKLYYSSVIKDEPVERYYANGGAGPKNWYSGYKGNMLLPDAIEWSSNGTAAQAINMIGVENAYNQVVTLQGFTHLSEQDKMNVGGLSIGGLNGGVTVREMAATYTYLGNGGRYYKPYTYYYITDSEDNIIIDNRDTIPKESYSPETAYIMNRLLHYNITYSTHTNAAYARIDGWDIVGKTGSTEQYKDSWFCGVSPYCSLAIWTGFDQPKTVTNAGQRNATTIFKNVMSEYLSGKKHKSYAKPASIIEANYNPGNGAIYNQGSATESKYIGYYTKGNLPSASTTNRYVADYNHSYSAGGGSGSGSNSASTSASTAAGQGATTAPAATQATAAQATEAPKSTEAAPATEAPAPATEAEPHEGNEE